MNCYFNYADAALLELYREMEGKPSLQGECVWPRTERESESASHKHHSAKGGGSKSGGSDSRKAKGEGSKGGGSHTKKESKSASRRRGGGSEDASDPPTSAMANLKMKIK